MNQTMWIIGGGLAAILLAVGLYIQSGDESNTVPLVAEQNTDSAEISVEEVTPSSASPLTITQTPPSQMDTNTNESRATLRTSMGDITIKFYPIDAPKTVENFVKLANSGFYNGVRFHRVIKGFMNQTGDPLSKDDAMMPRWGTGDPGYKFADEINANSALYTKGYKHGVVAMANSGPNTNGSQFFIMAADYPLPPSYTIFGEVVSGLDVVDAINGVKTSQDRPLTPVTITSVEVK